MTKFLIFYIIELTLKDVSELKTIGQRVRHLRQQKEISMDELAKSIRIPVMDGELTMHRSTTSATISNIENDKNNPSAEIIIALSNFFKVSTDWILTGKEFEHKDLSLMDAVMDEAVEYSAPLIIRQLKEMQDNLDRINEENRFIREKIAEKEKSE